MSLGFGLLLGSQELEVGGGSVFYSSSNSLVTVRGYYFQIIQTRISFEAIGST